MSRPYLETKVVKVKKPEVTIADRNDKNWKYVSDKDLVGLINIAHGKLRKREISRRGKGNWVNEENLDKIKFPVPCSYIHNTSGKKHLGMVSKGYNSKSDEDVYSIICIDKQVNGKDDGQLFSRIYTNDSLKNLIEYHNVHIKKGKIIIFEENENKEYDIDIEEGD